MISSDRDILISINGRLERIEQRLDALEMRVSVIERRTDVIEAKLETLQTSVYWGFAIMGLIFAFVGLFVPAMSSMFAKIIETKYDSYEQRKRTRAMIREEIAEALKHQQ